MNRVKWFVVSCALAMVATLACSTNMKIDVSVSSDAGVMLTYVDAGDGDGDASSDVDASVGDASTLLSDGAPCDVDTQCVNDYCVPSKNSFGSGVCFSAGTDGCVLVTTPSPFVTSCNVTANYLITCGDAYDTTALTDCAVVGVGAIGERYYCCPK